MQQQQQQQPIYEYENIRAVADFKRFFPEAELRANGYTDHFLLGLVKCVVKTLLRISSLAFNDATERASRILDKKMEKCFREMQFYMLSHTTSKNEAKRQILDILRIVREKLIIVRAENDNAGIITPYTRSMIGRLNIIIQNVEQDKFTNLSWAPSRLTFARRMDNLQPPTEFDMISEQMTDLRNLSSVPYIQQMAPEFRTQIEQYVEPRGYGKSGTKSYRKKTVLKAKTKAKTRKTR